MRDAVTVVLVGIGGMGSVYVRALLDPRNRGKCRIAGAVDPAPERCPQLREIQDLGIPLFSSLEDFYEAYRADLAIISSPIQFHSAQTCLALSKGSHVLCEKPAAGTIQEVREMTGARDASKKRVAVGYQWSFSSSIQELKRDILAGAFGRPLRLKCLYLWPRDEAYFRRSDWAGKIRDPEGRWILDSPANNAMAHDLHNMFYVLGGKIDESAAPAWVEAELCRAYPIENFDTAAMRCRTADEVEILFYASHASRIEKGPVFSYEFEKAAVHCASRASGITAVWTDGGTKKYPPPDDEPLNKLWQAIGMADSGEKPACGLEAAGAQTLCLNGMQDSMPEIAGFPVSFLHSEPTERSSRIWVDGLDRIMEDCYLNNALPSELGASWSRKGERVRLIGYSRFPAEGGPR